MHGNFIIIIFDLFVYCAYECLFKNTFVPEEIARLDVYCSLSEFFESTQHNMALHFRIVRKCEDMTLRLIDISYIFVYSTIQSYMRCECENSNV